MRRLSIWDIIDTLPEKRQQRLKSKMEEEFEIEIDFNEIEIVEETEYYITAMVPCITEENPPLYIQYTFKNGTVTFYYLNEDTRLPFFKRVMSAIRYIFTGQDPSGTKKTKVALSDCEKIIDYLASIVEDMTSSAR